MKVCFAFSLAVLLSVVSVHARYPFSRKATDRELRELKGDVQSVRIVRELVKSGDGSDELGDGWIPSLTIFSKNGYVKEYTFTSERCPEVKHMNRHLVDDLQMRLGVNNLFDWIDVEGERLAQIGTTPSGCVEFTEDVLCARKIRGIYEDDVVGNACIKPAIGDQYDIFYRRGLPSEPRRFAIAHEIGHTCWFTPGGGASPLSPMQWRLGRDPSIEYLCNRFAASLLLPRGHFLTTVRTLLRDQNEIGMPLHIIPLVSTRYQVAEQAVARRLFFQLFPSSTALVCFRLAYSEQSSSSSKSDGWVTSWCSLPSYTYERERVSGFSVPLSRSGRKIPSSMIPQISSGKTHYVELDGRWRESLKQFPLKQAKIPFERIAPKETSGGYAARVGGRFYFALML